MCHNQAKLWGRHHVTPGQGPLLELPWSNFSAHGDELRPSNVNHTKPIIGLPVEDISRIVAPGHGTLGATLKVDAPLRVRRRLVVPILRDKLFPARLPKALTNRWARRDPPRKSYRQSLTLHPKLSRSRASRSFESPWHLRSPRSMCQPSIQSAQPRVLRPKVRSALDESMSSF